MCTGERRGCRLADLSSIGQKGEVTVDVLSDESGLDTAVVASSLDRLDRYLLIDRTGGKIRALSVGEALVKCHAKNDKTLPLRY